MVEKVEKEQSRESLVNEVLSNATKASGFTFSGFNFLTNEVLTVGKIVNATFQNPDRKKYKSLVISAQAYALYEEGAFPEFYLEMIRTKLPNAAKKLEDAQIHLYDTTKLNNSINQAKWLDGLRSSKWFGPFKAQYSKVYKFHSATGTGVFEGLLLNIDMDHNKIQIGYYSPNSG